MVVELEIIKKKCFTRSLIIILQEIEHDMQRQTYCQLTHSCFGTWLGNEVEIEAPVTFSHIPFIVGVSICFDFGFILFHLCQFE